MGDDSVMSGSVVGPDGLARCPWAADHPVNTAYHDTEWGMPVRGEAAYLERLTLEAFQSGLSWLTILNKREAFREAFAGFDADAVAAYDDSDVDRLMAALMRRSWPSWSSAAFRSWFSCSCRRSSTSSDQISSRGRRSSRPCYLASTSRVRSSY